MYSKYSRCVGQMKTQIMNKYKKTLEIPPPGFMDGQLRWRTLVLETWSTSVCWSDRKFQSGDFSLWSCSVTIRKSLWQCFHVPDITFDCQRMGVSCVLNTFTLFHLRTRSWVLGGLWKPEILLSSITDSSFSNEGKFHPTQPLVNIESERDVPNSSQNLNIFSHI